ncbi:MAG: HAD family hydrolase [Cellulomonadaceae bacterium]|jgi:HAD superfamily hydrolase (TIGR01549 family)|nr:HAD family hydrolase [Cellulomonadaceae bacterium]
MAITAVVFDVGETLIDESRIWLRWADRLGIPPLTLLSIMGGGGLAAGISIGQAFDLLRPGIDVEAEEARWAADEPDSLRSGFDADDLYPDVRPALTALHDAGLRVIIAGNQPAAALAALRAMNLPVDAMKNSAEMGVEKPDPAFFQAVVTLAGVPAQQIAYVGDRLDNDVLPAASAGMMPVLIRRGPFGYLHALRPEAARAAVIDSLNDLPALLGAH